MLQINKFNLILNVSKQTHLFFLFLLCLCSQSHAAAIGVIPSTLQIAWGSNINWVNVNDQNGQSDNKFSTQTGSLFITDWLSSNSRFLAELYTSNYAFTATGSHTGQQVNNRGLRLSLQGKTIGLKNLSPLFGLGIDLAYSKFSKRHKVDNDGYLIEQFEDISKPSYKIILNVMESWSWTEKIKIGFKLEYSIPITQAIHGFSSSVLLLYQPDFHIL